MFRKGAIDAGLGDLRIYGLGQRSHRATMRPKATADHVTREANLIARQFECLGADRAADATADHIRRFWAPLLKSRLVVEGRDHAERLSPIARHALAKLT